jgi:hypothetical protein
MMFGLDALSVPEHLNDSLERIEPSRVSEAATTDPEAIALVASGSDDRSVALAARLLERGLAVRANTRASELDGRALPIGSIAITRDDNRDRDGWQQVVADAAAELGLAVRPVGFGRAPGEKADLGGGYWQALEPPQVALLAHGRVNMLDFGSVWYLLETTASVSGTATSTRIVPAGPTCGGTTSSICPSAGAAACLQR